MILDIFESMWGIAREFLFRSQNVEHMQTRKWHQVTVFPLKRLCKNDPLQSLLNENFPSYSFYFLLPLTTIIMNDTVKNELYDTL